MAFEYASYVARTLVRAPSEITRNARAQPEVRSAMLAHRKRYAVYEASGSTRNLRVHHVIPVAVWPEGAADAANLITLNKFMHYALGHGSSGWTSFNPHIREHAALVRKSIIRTERRA